MTALCPYNWGDNTPTFCHDGFPSSHKSTEGDIRCEAYRTSGTLSDVCLSDACASVVTLNGVDYRIKPCEANDDCPYEGCMRHRVILDIPAEMAARAIEHRCQMLYERDNKKSEQVVS